MGNSTRLALKSKASRISPTHVLDGLHVAIELHITQHDQVPLQWLLQDPGTSSDEASKGLAGTHGLRREGLSQADVLTVVLALTGIGGVVFRKTAKARIA